MAAEAQDEISFVDINEVLVSDVDMLGDVMSCMDGYRTTSPLSRRPDGLEDSIGRNPSVPKATSPIPQTWDIKTFTNDTLLREVHILRKSNKTLQDNSAMLIRKFDSQQKDLLKVREKVSSLFQENCGLKEQLAKQSLDNRIMREQASNLKEDNAKLRKRLSQISQQVRGFAQSGELESPNCSFSRSNAKFDIDSPIELQIKNDPLLPCNIPHVRIHSSEESLTALKQGSWTVQSRKVDMKEGNVLERELAFQKEKLTMSRVTDDMVRHSSSVENSHADQEDVFDILGDNDSLKLLATSHRQATRLKRALQSQNTSLKLMLIQQQSLNKLIGTSSSSLDANKLNCHSQKLHPSVSMPDLVSSGNPRLLPKAMNDSKNLPSDSKNTPVRWHRDGEVVSDMNCKAMRADSSTNISSKFSNTSNIPKSQNQFPAQFKNAQLSVSQDKLETKPILKQGGTSNNEFPQSRQSPVDDERICPLCQAAFPNPVPQEEFEAHVMSHFESDEFEIINDDDY